MFAITIDSNCYVKSFSDKFRTPGSFLAKEIPETNIEKLRCYQYIDGVFSFDAEKWDAIEAEREEKAAQMEAQRQEAAKNAEIERARNATFAEIEALKAQIAGSDYKIIKCYEYALNNLSLPYDMEALHNERQAIREEINALENKIIQMRE